MKNPRPVKFIFFFLLHFAFLFPLEAGNPSGLALADSLRKMAGSDPDKVIRVADSLEKAALEMGDSLLYVRTLDAKGLAKRNKGDYAEAIRIHSLAYSIYQQMHNQRSAAGNLSSIGIIMLRTNQMKEAKKYFLDALKMLEPTDSVMLNVVYTNLGVAYDYSDRPDKAIESYQQAMRYINPTDKYSLAVSELNIGVCHDFLKDFRQAEACYFRALEYQKSTGNQDLLARICISLGGMYFERGNMEKAYEFFERGGKAAKESHSVELEEKYYENLIPFYIRKKDSEKALYYVGKLNKLKAEIYSREQSKSIAEAETHFKVALKNKEIENLTISKNLADLKMERDRWIRLIMLGVLTLSLIILFIVYRNYKLRKKNIYLLAREKKLVESEKMILEKNNELLESQNILARYEILKSQVSPHFLFNTLNALSYLIESDPEKAVAFTNAFSKLYRKVLELKDKNLITLEEELSHVTSYFFLQQTRFGNKLKIRQEIGKECLQCRLPPFCIQLTVENAINHNRVTETEPLMIRIYTKDHVLYIENNLQPRAETVKSTSVGIANIRARYSFFTENAPEFTKTSGTFIARLPLLSAE